MVLQLHTDYQEVAGTVERAWKKCRQGVYLVWYPMLPPGGSGQAEKSIAGQWRGVPKIA